MTKRPAAAGEGIRLWLASLRLAKLFVPLATLSGALIFALPATGLDSLQPGSVSVTLQPGQATTISKTLHLDTLPTVADIEIAIDTTGSMDPSIAQAKADATSIVNNVRAAIADARFAVVSFKDSTDTSEYQLLQSLTDNAASVQSAIDGMTAGGGGDAPEAYNLVFHNSYSPDLGGPIGWRSNSRKFVIVIGDAQPHGAGKIGQGLSGCTDTSDDPHALSTATELAGMAAAKRTLMLIRQVATTTTVDLSCYSSLAAAAYPTGTAVNGGGSLSDQIVSLVGAAASSIGRIDLAVSPDEGTPASAASWFSFSPTPPFTPIEGSFTAPLDLSFSEMISVPAGTASGDYGFTISGSADGTPRATEHVVVHVRSQSVSNLSLSVDQATTTPGVQAVAESAIPIGQLPFVFGTTLSAPAGSTGIGAAPAGSTPAGSTPAGSTPAGSTAIGSLPAGSTLLGFAPAGSTPAGSTPAGSTALDNVLLSQIPLIGKSWQTDVLAGTTLDGKLLNTLTLHDVAANAQAYANFRAIDLKNVDLSSSAFQGAHLVSFLFGSLPLNQVALPAGQDWCTFLGLASTSAACANLHPESTTVLGADVSGNVGSTDLGSLPAGSTPAGSTPAGSTPAGSTAASGLTSIPLTAPAGSTATFDLAASRVGSIRLSALQTAPPAPSFGPSSIIRCSDAGDPTPSIDCSAGAAKTISDAAAANAIRDGVTLGAPALVAAYSSANPGITYNDILLGVLAPVRAALPWNLVRMDGLQDLSTPSPTVTYHLKFDFQCANASTVDASVTLPPGFLVKPGSSKLNASTVADPHTGPAVTSLATTPPQAQQFFWSELAPGCGSNDLSFLSYPGIDLGTFRSGRAPSSAIEDPGQRAASVFDNNSLGSSLAATDSGNQSTITVVPATQAGGDAAGEPNDDPTTAPVLQKDVLYAGHIAVSGDQDNFRYPLTGLARGTRITVYLDHIAAGSDFDLTLTKPSAPGFQSTPAGSTALNNPPVEDTTVGFDNSQQRLSSTTLQDIPAGSTPAGSTPAGSTPAGSTQTASISARRGDADEVAQVVTSGESGNLTIGVTGYNGSTSNQPYMLRVQVTPPPPLPHCPARSFPNATPAANALPASLPAATKTLFLVNRQRLVATYGQAATDALLTKIGSQSTPGSFAARPEVTGSVLQVDGNAAVRGAYAAWDADNGPCSIDAANNVVTAINDVVAGYRNSTSGLPNLRYIVLLGNDEALPMRRVLDPVTLSPESNNAAELAFTTNGLTAGNALYASAAQDTILSDGAYGAFNDVQWLGHSLALPQISVSRLLESPGEMSGLIDQYLNATVAGASKPGVLDPQSALISSYDFINDGGVLAKANLGTRFNLSAPALDSLLDPTAWTSDDLKSHFFNKAPVPDIGALYGHYNHYEIQPSSLASGLLKTSDLADPLPVAGRILFTVGCHAGLNVSDSLSSDAVKRTDWAQQYLKGKAAVYLANTGYGYGDSDSTALSERLLGLFSQNLNSDGGSIGEQWTNALHQYFQTAGDYAVIDEKVMVETTLYGLPFWHFNTPGTQTPPAPVPTTADPATGAQVSGPITVTSSPTPTTDPQGGTFYSDNGQTQWGLYRPIVALKPTEVTSTLPAHGFWVKSLVTQDSSTPERAALGSYVSDLAAHEPKPNFPATFFPAAMFALDRSVVFGKERDRLIVRGQFRPNGPLSQLGTSRNFISGTFQIGYSSSVDFTQPLITDVQVHTTGTAPNLTSKISARITDDSGTVSDAAALVNDGSWHFLQLAKSAVDPELWEGTSTGLVLDPEVIVQAHDASWNSSLSANKGSNFTSASTAALQQGPQITILNPFGNYGPNQAVTATFACKNPDGSAAASCTATNDGNPIANGQAVNTATFGQHTFVVKASDGSGNESSLQRTYTVAYNFKGFFAPVDNQPTLNLANAGQAIPIRFSLSGNQGLDIFAAGFPKSQTIACDATAAADGIDQTVNPGSSTLTYDASTDRYQYVWKTDKAWAGTCRALIVKTKDGVSHRADFKFK